MRPDGLERRTAHRAQYLFQALLVGDGQLVTALPAAAGQYAAAVFGGHAAAETVLVFARASGRLISTFHRYFFKKYTGGLKKRAAKVRAFLKKKRWR
jgi:hypothetical protein